MTFQNAFSFQMLYYNLINNPYQMTFLTQSHLSLSALEHWDSKVGVAAGEVIFTTYGARGVANSSYSANWTFSSRLQFRLIQNKWSVRQIFMTIIEQRSISTWSIPIACMSFQTNYM